MNQLQDVKVDVVSLVDRAAVRDPQNKSEPRRFLLYKREGAASTPTDQGGSMPPTDTAELSKEELDTHYKDELAKAQAKIEELEKLAAEGSAPDDEENPVHDDQDGDEMGSKKPSSTGKDLPHQSESELSKAEAADLRAQLAKAETDRAALQKQVEDSTKIAKEERDLRELGEWIEKTDETFEALPIEARELGPILKRASETLPSEDYERIDGLLKAADEAMRQSKLFKEAGRGGIPDGAANDPVSRVMRKAEEIEKSDSGIKPSEALAQALKSDPQLEREYLLQERGSLR